MSNSEREPVLERLSAPAEAEEKAAPPDPAKKKPFVEPAISAPVDALEATKFFFQVPVDSGSL